MLPLMRKTSTMQTNGKIRSHIFMYFINIFLSRVNTSHNQSVTDSIVKEVVQAAEYTDKDVIACKIFLFLNNNVSFLYYLH